MDIPDHDSQSFAQGSLPSQLISSARVLLDSVKDLLFTVSVPDHRLTWLNASAREYFNRMRGVPDAQGCKLQEVASDETRATLFKSYIDQAATQGAFETHYQTDIDQKQWLLRFEAYLLNTCDQAIAYAERVGEGGIGILYDTFHANIEEKDPLAALHALHASGNLAHVHISENDRGTPGRGHAQIAGTIRALKALGYDGWLTIEAFGRGVPELAAATRVWRDFFASPEEVFTEGYSYIRQCWDR